MNKKDVVANVYTALAKGLYLYLAKICAPMEIQYVIWATHGYLCSFSIAGPLDSLRLILAYVLPYTYDSVDLLATGYLGGENGRPGIFIEAEEQAELAALKKYVVADDGVLIPLSSAVWSKISAVFRNNPRTYLIAEEVARALAET